MKTSFKEKFLAIADFLEQWEFLHEKEFLKRYPSPYPGVIRPWIDEICEWSPQKLALFESTGDPEMVGDPTFKKYLKTINELCRVETKTLATSKLGEALSKKINQKKRHELGLLKAAVDVSEFDAILDIGGGAGYLSCALLEDSILTSTCVDMDEAVQRNGLKYCEEILGPKASQINFKSAKFSRSTEVDIEGRTLALSLHGCGSLSSDVVRFAAEKGLGLLNFGCCYHKLNGAYNLSEFSNKCSIEFTTNALHLASRCAKIVDGGAILDRMRFKRHRYSLHYLLHARSGLGFAPTGNAKKSDYAGSFSSYAKKFAPQGQLDGVSERELEAFYEDPKTLLLFRENFAADLIRLFLGRAIELYIVLDRAIYLEEAGRPVEVFELFDRTLSPRNLMLFSLQEN